MNKIVLMELWAGARSKIEENILKQYERTIPLVGLSDQNFITTGQVLKRMTTEYNLEPHLRRRLTWDILIALSAKENNSLLITENESDFRKIRKFIDFEFMPIMVPKGRGAHSP